MSRPSIIGAVFAVLCFNWAAVSVSSAQTFEERWSPVPKAHAEPSPEAQPYPQSGPPAESRGPKAPKSPSTAQARERKERLATSRGHVRRAFSGRASFYAYKAGKTASGGTFDRDGLTAAHRTLPFGTQLRVTDEQTRKSVHVVITDRGPAAKTRVLDLSLGAARALGVGNRGIIQVHAEIIGRAAHTF